MQVALTHGGHPRVQAIRLAIASNDSASGDDASRANRDPRQHRHARSEPASVIHSNRLGDDFPGSLVAPSEFMGVRDEQGLRSDPALLPDVDQRPGGESARRADHRSGADVDVGVAKLLPGSNIDGLDVESAATVNPVPSLVCGEPIGGDDIDSELPRAVVHRPDPLIYPALRKGTVV